MDSLDLSKIKSFVDLGSGTGKAVLLAALLFPHMKKCIGIEILKELHENAVKCLKEFRALDCKCAIEFVCADCFTRDDWYCMDLIFITTTCFTTEQMQKLVKRLPLLKEGAFLITTTRALESSVLLLKKKQRVRYAKGSLLFFLWQKVG